MNHARWIVVLTGAAAAALLSGCGPQRIRTPQHPGQDLIVLLPDVERGTIGHATVSNPSGNADLARARDSTRVSANEAPSPVTVMSEAEVQRLFGDTLAALPPPPRHFTLNFRFESELLTDESRALLPQVLQAVKELRAPEILVVGHTDTTGTSASNYELGLRRARMVRGLLLEGGLDASFVEVASHGESDLLIPTADNTLEPRNRRVEITVR
jgi:outer membrane protein OmpA-like peptidoglycan-associated protein